MAKLPPPRTGTSGARTSPQEPSPSDRAYFVIDNNLNYIVQLLTLTQRNKNFLIDINLPYKQVQSHAIFQEIVTDDLMAEN